MNKLVLSSVILLSRALQLGESSWMVSGRCSAKVYVTETTRKERRGQLELQYNTQTHVVVSQGRLVSDVDNESSGAFGAEMRTCERTTSPSQDRSG